MTWHPEKEGVLNHGPYYAPKTQLDAHGNRILWGWIPEEWADADMTKHGWSGCMSLPRIMTLEHGEARFIPAPAINTLRGPLPASVPYDLQADVVFTIQRRRPNTPLPQKPRVSTLAVMVRTNPEPGVRTLRFGTEDISLPEMFPVFDVRCFVDHSLIEIFIGDAVVLTRRVYDGSPTIVLLPSDMEVVALDAHTIASL